MNKYEEEQGPCFEDGERSHHDTARKSHDVHLNTAKKVSAIKCDRTPRTTLNLMHDLSIQSPASAIVDETQRPRIVFHVRIL